MAVQGFFSPDKKTRMAGEKENNATDDIISDLANLDFEDDNGAMCELL